MSRKRFNESLKGILAWATARQELSHRTHGETIVKEGDTTSHEKGRSKPGYQYLQSMLIHLICQQNSTGLVILRASVCEIRAKKAKVIKKALLVGKQKGVESLFLGPFDV
jgi:hypothetical protein